MARLILTTAEGQTAVELRSHNSLGRHPNNTIQLLDKIVSKEHCILEERSGQFVLRDLGSLNGTYINGERVKGEQGLRHGDEIALGATRARFEDGSGAPVQPPPVSPGVVSQPLGHGGAAPPARPPMPSTGGYAAAPSGAHGVASAANLSSSPSGAYAYTGRANSVGVPPPNPPNPSGPLPAGAPSPSVNRSNPMNRTRVDLSASARSIGTQIAAQTKGFIPFDQLAPDPVQLRIDYERLRITWELSREIGLEHDLDRLLDKILTALFKFVNADRGAILLAEADGTLQPKAAKRRDGTDAPIEVSSTILNHVIKEKASVLSHDASTDFAASKGKSMILNRITSAMVVPLLHEKEVLGALWLDAQSIAQFQAKDLELITAVANQAAMFIQNNLLARKIEQEIVTRERFSRLLSPNVAEQVISGKLEVRKGGQSLEKCTVFNSDIRGFTNMSEGTQADVMVEMLNEYFELMVDRIFKFEGTLDKFMGDGIMAFWGAPMARPDDPIRCVESALDQMAMLDGFNSKRVAEGRPSISIGMGIHTGPLVVGYVGSSKALSYTVIGDTANTSARLCGIAEAGQVIVSEATLRELRDRFEVTELAPAKLKGKEKPMRIFNVTRMKTSTKPNG